MKALRVVLVAVIGFAAPAGAATITFDGIPLGSACNTPTRVCVTSWTEDGITATGNIAGFLTFGAVHLDAWPGVDSFGKRIDITTGSLFDALDINVDPQGQSFTSQCAGALGHPPSSCVVPYSEVVIEPLPYIGVSGFRDGQLVAQLVFYRSGSDGFETISLEGFPSVDRLRIEAMTYLDLGVQGACISLACAHFALASVTLEPVPEPRAGILLALGLLTTAFATRSADR